MRRYLGSPRFDSHRDITDATLLKIVLMLVANPGTTAPAATAKPAIMAYSIRSWPLVSFHRRMRVVNRITLSIRGYISALNRSIVAVRSAYYEDGRFDFEETRRCYGPTLRSSPLQLSDVMLGREERSIARAPQSRT